MATRVFASGIGAPEGPVALADGGMLVTEMSQTTLCVSHLDASGYGWPTFLP